MALLHGQFREVHRDLDECLDECVRALARASRPAGSAQVRLYVHAATVEDLVIHSLLRGVSPLFATIWQGKGPANYSTRDLEPIRSYAGDVFAASDAYLAALTPNTASETVDLSRMGLGHPTVAWVLSRFVVLELCQITGELRSLIYRPGASA
ncbi:MAG: hypothetical protein M3069_20285 [Chloroflexota bacterium]|nr:hypothetical protein [Chloroflexota bacterium]